MVEDTRKLLVKDGLVWVPDFFEGVKPDDLQVLLVELQPWAIPLPDPMLLGIRSASNWMAQKIQEALPACSKLSISDSENDFLDSGEDGKGLRDTNGSRSTSFPRKSSPISEAVFLPTVAVVTKLWEGGSESGCESDLESGLGYP